MRRLAERSVRDEVLAESELAVITGPERADLAAWLVRVGGWWTPQEALAGLDDLVAGLDVAGVLRVCASEGFAQVGEHERHGDRYVFLLAPDGLFGVVYLARHRTGPRPWSLTIFGNRLVQDTGLFTACPANTLHQHEVLLDGRWIAAGSLRWHLSSPHYGRGSLRAALAALRATSTAINPWQYAAVTTWIGPDTPHGMDDQPHDEITRAARTRTRNLLAHLPEPVRAVLGPQPMSTT